MSTFLNPVGPQPASVYWRRRIVVGMGLLAVIVIILLIIFQPGRGEEPVSGPSPSGEPDASPSASPAVTVEECDPLDIRLEPITDKNSYAAGEFPQLSLRVTNEGLSACSINLGSTQQEFRITSGSDEIWSSRDCQVDPVDAVLELEAGESLTSPAVEWDRTRSSATTCDAERSQVTAAGASYHLRVYLGDLESEGTAQFLLN